MVGPAIDCLTNPLGAVRQTFEKVVNTSNLFNPSSVAGKDWGVVDVFRTFLFEQDGISQVPTLTQATLPWIRSNSLVRFRGMIQDMLGKEYYVGAFKDGCIWRTNKYSDISLAPIDLASETQFWERHLLYCVPVPGQNLWSMEFSPSKDLTERCNISFSSQRGEKRQRDTADLDTESNGLIHECCTSSRHKKLSEGLPELLSNVRTYTATSKPPVTSSVDSKLLPCIVKMYDSVEPDPKLNEIFEFIGVFTFDPELVVPKNDCDDVDLSDDGLAHPPPSKVPRLHCLIHRKLMVQDFLPISHVFEIIPNNVKVIRESLFKYIKSVLCNDGLAAQYVLLHLLSKVDARVGTFAVGNLSLNLSCLNGHCGDFGCQLSLVIQDLLPFSQYIPLTVDYLNTAVLAPRKDYQTNRLVTGDLQLAKGTHLMVDETHLKPGILDSVGVSNVRLLKNLIERQKVEYEFDYYKIEMDADIQMLVLSEGKSNILPADLVLSFRPVDGSCFSNAHPDEVRAWRWYLATFRLCAHVIEHSMQQAIEDDMVAAKKEDLTLGVCDFSRWLTMARLMSASYGEKTLSLEHWQMVKEMERLRKERFMTERDLRTIGY